MSISISHSFPIFLFKGCLLKPDTQNQLDPYAFLTLHIQIDLPDMYPEKNTIQKYTCTPIIIAALFTIAKTWKQLTCLSTEEWIKKMWGVCVCMHIQWNILLSHQKVNNNAVCSNMDAPGDGHTK